MVGKEDDLESALGPRQTPCIFDDSDSEDSYTKRSER
jgi:hypothetical protein